MTATAYVIKCKWGYVSTASKNSRTVITTDLSYAKTYGSLKSALSGEQQYRRGELKSDGTVPPDTELDGRPYSKDYASQESFDAAWKIWYKARSEAYMKSARIHTILIEETAESFPIREKMG